MIGGSRTEDDSPSWDVAINTRGLDNDSYGRLKNETPGVGAGRSMTWLDPVGKDEEFRDGMATTEAIHMLENHGQDPFFLAVGFYRPHNPNVAPRHYFDLYQLEDITVPQEPVEHLSAIPKAAFQLDESNHGLSDEKLAVYMRAYYASISFVDAQVGRLMAALKRLDLDKNTIVVFVSDHGYMLGEHGEWFKTKLFERALRVPLIVVDPRNKNKGRSSKRIVELLDLYPTIAELAGLQPPSEIEGQSLVPLLDDPVLPWKDEAFSTVSRGLFQRVVLKDEDYKVVTGLSVRTARYRYTEWNKGDEGAELYDYVTDPNEWKNLVGDLSHIDIRNKLRRQLEEYRKRI